MFVFSTTSGNRIRELSEQMKGETMNEPIKYGDRVMCVTFPGQPRGFVIKQYYPTACPQQTQIMCDDGRIFHAPTSDFVKI